MRIMIVVFCGLGGENLLGRAREIADTLGERVIAMVASEDKVDAQRLIYLGADEVLECEIDKPTNWIDAISNIIQTENQLKSIIFPSNILSNTIMGAVYSRKRERVSVYLDDVDLLVGGTTASKSFGINGFSLQASSKASKVCLFSAKISSVLQPLEDSSRYGKKRSLESKKLEKKASSPILLDVLEEPLNSSGELTVLVGSRSGDRINELARKLSQKYRAKLRKYSGATEVVYGPCIAIE
ncbi:MAG: hypothetical protein ACREBS_09465, partial [Nitrososphaerales archaeon]